MDVVPRPKWVAFQRMGTGLGQACHFGHVLCLGSDVLEELFVGPGTFDCRV